MIERDLCGNTDALLEYLYEEADAATAQLMEAHVESCAGCRGELDALRGVRRGLQHWTPPSARLDFRIVQESRTASWLARPPAWAVAAAAGLLLAVSAAIARVEVRYDDNGLVVRTGWTVDAPLPPLPTRGVQTREDHGGTATPWRTDVEALETRLRAELVAAARERRQPGVPRDVGSAADAELLRRVRTLVTESEERQQRELALRLTQALQDVERQRRADLVRIQQGFGQLEGLTGAEVARQRQMLNYLVSVSERVP